MKIILKENVKNVGLKNEIVEVSDGFASNSLIPRGLAVPATKSEIKKLQTQKAKHYQELKDQAKYWIGIKKEIEEKIFIDYAKSKDGILIKNISRKHVLEILNKELSEKLNKNQLPNKYGFGMGTNSYPIDLYPGITAIARIEIKEKK